MSDHALVVGIECYASPRLDDLQGPSLDAIRFALWLRITQKVPAKNIVFVHNKCDQWAGTLEAVYQKELKSLLAEGVEPREEPSLPAITALWRQQLLVGPMAPGTLWIYWSGHGVTFPQRKQAMMCCDLTAGVPTYVYLSELQDSLRTDEFVRFDRQRVIVDACAEHMAHEDLKMGVVRNPDTFQPVNEPEQIVLCAVAVGNAAQADEGSSLFTSMLLRHIEKGWPDDIVTFYATLSDEIAKVADETKLPRLAVVSPRFEDGLLRKGDRREQDCKHLLGAIFSSDLPYDRYRSYYQRAMGPVSAEPSALAATSVTEMVKELMELRAEPAYGGFSRALVEWLSRVVRDHPIETGPIAEWLQQIPAGARMEVNGMLDGEQRALVLICLLVETTFNPSGFPVSMSAYLFESNFSRVVQTWTKTKIKSRSNLDDELQQTLSTARMFSVKQNVALTVHVFANPPLLGVAYHALRLYPGDQEDSRSFGHFHPFFVRSRARLHCTDMGYDFESWRKKAEKLRALPAKSIRFRRVTECTVDRLSKIDGLLSIRDVLSEPEIDAGKTPAVAKLVSMALKCGLPLLAWRTAPPPRGNWKAFEKKMKDLFKKCQRVSDLQYRLRDERKSEPWARDTVLLWDDDDHGALRAKMTQEPQQQ